MGDRIRRGDRYRYHRFSTCPSVSRVSCTATRRQGPAPGSVESNQAPRLCRLARFPGKERLRETVVVVVVVVVVGLLAACCWLAAAGWLADGQ